MRVAALFASLEIWMPRRFWWATTALTGRAWTSSPSSSATPAARIVRISSTTLSASSWVLTVRVRGLQENQGEQSLVAASMGTTGFAQDYEFSTYGWCMFGYYAGWEENSNRDSLENCMRACNLEDRCKFFSFLQGQTCSRYDTDSCFSLGLWPYSIYKKKDLPYMWLGAGFCEDGYYAGWESNSNKDSLGNCKTACDMESECKYIAFKQGSTCSRYNGNSCTIRAQSSHAAYKKVNPSFKLASVGYCSHGYYAGWETNSFKDSLKNCMSACEAEQRCKYFSFWLGNTCSRYDTYNCQPNTDTSHVTYKRVMVPPACCTGGDFVHTSDKCRSRRVYMKGEHHHWLPEGHSEVSLAGNPEGTGEVHWECHARRRRCGLLGCGGTGYERTGFDPPATDATVHYNGETIDYWPKYCAPEMPWSEESPADRGCCSIADGTVDRCRSSSYIKIQVGSTWKYCYKNQICEWEFPTPQTQGVKLSWYCGNTEEKVRWGLYFDTLQVKFHCDGKVEWNPWWCGLATGGKAPARRLWSRSLPA
ncbi:unnamed protein product [Effrenium voratum]|uniref:Uncharacterized protein n=1 Tax=Effrenium voratum TaxID=2562239 RepID=A0AA36I3E9_9DINO|nr:unnamed protein product [Effrenium voratum]